MFSFIPSSATKTTIASFALLESSCLLPFSAFLNRIFLFLIRFSVVVFRPNPLCGKTLHAELDHQLSEAFIKFEKQDSRFKLAHTRTTQAPHNI